MSSRWVVCTEMEPSFNVCTYTYINEQHINIVHLHFLGCPSVVTMGGLHWKGAECQRLYVYLHKRAAYIHSISILFGLCTCRHDGWSALKRSPVSNAQRDPHPSETTAAADFAPLSPMYVYIYIYICIFLNVYT